jgi:hypothetical protein
MFKTICLAVTLLTIASTANAGAKKQLERAAALTPAHFQETATIKDDNLDVTATITTEKGLSETKGLLRVVWDDNFLRAFINKKNGTVKYQLYQFITYGPDWRNYYGVNYLSPTGEIEQADLTLISKDVGRCSARNGCDLTESFGFSISEQFLRAYAAKYDPNKPTVWSFKFKAKNGNEWRDAMLTAEISGLLSAVDDYKRAHGLPAEVAPSAD